jgi:hypothetical protein
MWSNSSVPVPVETEGVKVAVARGQTLKVGLTAHDVLGDGVNFAVHQKFLRAAIQLH